MFVRTAHLGQCLISSILRIPIYPFRVASCARVLFLDDLTRNKNFMNFDVVTDNYLDFLLGDVGLVQSKSFGRHFQNNFWSWCQIQRFQSCIGGDENVASCKYHFKTTCIYIWSCRSIHKKFQPWAYISCLLVSSYV